MGQGFASKLHPMFGCLAPEVIHSMGNAHLAGGDLWNEQMGGMVISLSYFS